MKAIRNSFFFLFLLLFFNTSGSTTRDSLRSVFYQYKAANDTTAVSIALKIRELQRAPDSILFWLQQALDAAERGTVLQRIKILRNRSDFYLHRHQFAKALKDINTYRALAEQSVQLQYLAESYLDQGEYYRMQQSDSCLMYYEKAIEKGRESGNHHPVTTALYNKGLYYGSKGAYAEGLSFLLQALTILNVQQDYGGQAAVSNGVAVMHQYLRNRDRAISYYRKAVKALDRSDDDDPALRSDLHYNIGTLHWRSKRNDSALYHLRIASSLYDQLEQKNSQILCYNAIGNVLLKQERGSEARQFIKQALDLIGPKGSIVLRAMQLRDLGRIEVSLKNQEAAEEKWKEALALFEHRSAKGFESGIHHLLAKLYKKQEQFQKAFQHMERYSVLRDSLYPEDSKKRIAELEGQYWSQKQQQALDLSRKNEELQQIATARAEAESGKYAAQRNALIIGLFLIIIFSVLIYRLNLQRKRSQLMQKVSEIELKAIRAQMNPHFMFNALSSVQLLINKNNLRSANSFLSKFARLMRMILENSEQQMIYLEEELAMLNLYMELEALRFKFSYTVDVAPSIDSESIRIPSMVIQPFVENAIKHGIASKKEAGRIAIQLREADDCLLCTVEDNGIGRARSQAMKSPTLEHKSMGMRLTGERLQLLEKDVDKEQVKIEDLYDASSKAIGTRVVIRLPFEVNT